MIFQAQFFKKLLAIALISANISLLFGQTTLQREDVDFDALSMGALPALMRQGAQQNYRLSKTYKDLAYLAGYAKKTEKDSFDQDIAHLKATIALLNNQAVGQISRNHKFEALKHYKLLECCIDSGFGSFAKQVKYIHHKAERLKKSNVSFVNTAFVNSEQSIDYIKELLGKSILLARQEKNDFMEKVNKLNEKCMHIRENCEQISLNEKDINHFMKWIVAGYQADQ